MNIREKIMLDRQGLNDFGPINIVIFGDSVSHGAVNGYIDYENVYWNLLKRKLNKFRDYVPVNMINLSIGGTTAKESLPRFERHALIHEPDLVIICFGLNDVNGNLENYINSLESMFQRCIDSNVDVIFMTPNMLNTYVADDAPEQYRNYAAKTADFQNNGKMDEFMSSAVALAEKMDVKVCDCYLKWKELSKTEDTTLLLANRINHPVSEMHNLFADSLYEIIMSDIEGDNKEESTMYQE
ncbi:MAG: SGNH/GDSL hydrolase family protein [Clostridia bacterium]|nr:SGNH/GDSL hydrolase family protein [Clostridia bacterium]